MSFFSFSSNKEELSIIFDIGSGTLACALVHFYPDKPPQILYTYREPIISKRNLDSEHLTQAMLKTLDSVCSITMRDGFISLGTKNGAKKVNRIYYVFSSPWVFSQTKVVTVKKDREIAVTHELIESVVKDEEQLFEKMYKEGNFSDKFEYDLEVIERNVMQVSLNGYVTHNPYAKYAHKIEIPFFLSIVSKNIVKKIDGIVGKHFSFKSRSSHSCVLLSCLTLRDMYHDQNDFMFVDIHGELTDIGVIRNGVLVQTSSFPLGVNTIIRKIAKELNVVPQIAESYISIFLDGKADDKVAVSMKSVLSKVRKEWVELFHQSLDTLSKDGVIPHTVYLIVGGGMEHFFADFLKEEKFSLTMVEEYFNVIPLTSETFTQYGSYIKKIDRDPFLAMHTIALNKFKKHHGESVL